MMTRIKKNFVLVSRMLKNHQPEN